MTTCWPQNMCWACWAEKNGARPTSVLPPTGHSLRAVRAWEVRLAPLNAEFPELSAPNLLPQIEARLFPAPTRRRNLWRWLGAGSLVGALALGLVVLSPVLRTPPAPLLTARTGGRGSRLGSGRTFLMARS